MENSAATIQAEILIVEDSLVEAEILRRILVRSGYQVKLATNGEEGLQALREHPSALVISDIEMPLMNGYEMCRAIKLDENLWSIPVILVTMLSEPKDIIRALDVGADGYLTKPYIEAILLGRISSLLSNPYLRKFAEERRKIHLEYGNEKHSVAVGGQQMANLLLSVYENSLILNQELMRIQNQLNLLNESLDEKVQARTAALQDSEEKFRTSVDTIHDAFIIIESEHGTITWWNSAAETIFGYSKKEMIGQALHEHLPPPRYREAAQHGLAHFAKTGEGAAINKTLELSALHKNGTEFPIEVSLSAMQINGKWYAIGTVRDITKRKQMEEALKISSLKYQLLFESSRDALLMIAPPSWKFIGANLATLQLFGASSVAEFTALGPTDISPERQPDGRLSSEKAQEMIAIAMRKGAHFFEWQHRRLDGRPFAADVLLTRMKTNEEVFLHATVRDITERKQAENSLNRANRALKTLSAGNLALVRAENEDELLRTVTSVIVDKGGYCLAAVNFAEDDLEKSITPIAWAGFESSHYWAQHLSWADTEQGQLPISKSIRSGTTQLCHDIASDPAFKFQRAAALALGYRSNIALPLLDGKKIFGSLSIYSSDTDAFDEEEIRLLEELANDLAYGIVTLRARIEHERHTTILRESMEQSIETIASTVEARDPYTAGHQRRVGQLATAIAQEMGLPEDQVRGIHFAAIIHDLGKILIPTEILSKPGKITNLEYRLIQAHSQDGYDILKDVKYPWPIADIILQHHEKLDGSGYPQGLKGGQILLESRILTVADVVEAMSSHRPYRPGLGIEAALEDIERNRGVLFDPQVVDACIKLFRERDYKLSD